MATSTVRLDDGVREETTRIASQMGLSFNAVINIMARKFNEVKGFPFPVRLESQNRSVYDMSSAEFILACEEAVANRNDTNTAAGYITCIDEETGKMKKQYDDGHEEYIL